MSAETGGAGALARFGLGLGQVMVSTVVVLARLGLAVVFALAGAAKLADLGGSQRAARGFGVPAALGGVVGAVLPLAELAVAGALVFSGSARLGGIGALVLIGAFVVAIAAALVRGEQPDCHCFGQLHSARAGWATLARNLALAGVAVVVVVAGPQPSVTGWWASLSPGHPWLLAGVLAGVVVAAPAALIWQLLRRHGVALLRVRELAATSADTTSTLMIGDAAPSFDLPGLAGERVSLAGLLATGRDVLLVFTDPRCGPCQALLPRLATLHKAASPKWTVGLISRGSMADNLAAREEHGVRYIARQAEHETDAAYGVGATPSAILIGADGRIVGPLVVGADHVARLMKPEAEHHRPVANGATKPVRADRGARAGSATSGSATAGLATAAVAVTAAAAAPASAATPDATAAAGDRGAAKEIATALGNLLRDIAPQSFAASQALATARISAPGSSIRVPAAARAAWHRRLHDIDRAHASIARVHGADSVRQAALHALDVLRASCRDGELALTSPTAGKRSTYAKRQQADARLLDTAIGDLTARLHQAGATRL